MATRPAPGGALSIQPDRRQGARAIALPRLVTLTSSVFHEEVRLIDVGRLGFSVRTMVAHPPGSRLSLRVGDSSPLEARAVWHSHGRMGARFDEPLPEEILASLTGAG